MGAKKSKATSKAKSAGKSPAKSTAKLTAKSPAKSTAKSPAKSTAKSTAKSPAKSTAKPPAKSTAKSTAKSPAKSTAKSTTKSAKSTAKAQATSTATAKSTTGSKATAAKAPRSRAPKTPKVATNLAEAVAAFDLVAVRAFLAMGAKPDENDPKYGTLLGSVVGGFDHPQGPELARLLVEHGADPNRGTESSEPPLFMAAYAGQSDVARVLVDGGARIDLVSGSDQHTVLACAAAGGVLWLVEKCLAAGQDPNARSAQGHTPLQYAVDAQAYRRSPKGDCVPVARALLAAGADIHYDNAGSGWGTALHWAASRGTGEAVAFLLDNGAVIDARVTPGGEQPIHSAGLWGEPAAVDVLLARGADANARDDAGWTPLHCAAWSKSAAKVTSLLAAGADPNVRSTGPRRVTSMRCAAKISPVDLAKRRQALDVVKALRAT